MTKALYVIFCVSGGLSIFSSVSGWWDHDEGMDQYICFL